METTLERINSLSAERSTLYRLATNGRRGDPRVRQQIDQISAELESLWETRRRERAGRLDGIDLLVDRSYAQLYGGDYHEAVAPLRVDDGPEEAATLAA